MNHGYQQTVELGLCVVNVNISSKSIKLHLRLDRLISSVSAESCL